MSIFRATDPSCPCLTQPSTKSQIFLQGRGRGFYLMHWPPILGAPILRILRSKERSKKGCISSRNIYICVVPSWHFHPSQVHPSDNPIRKPVNKLRNLVTSYKEPVFTRQSWKITIQLPQVPGDRLMGWKKTPKRIPFLLLGRWLSGTTVRMRLQIQESVSRKISSHPNPLTNSVSSKPEICDEKLGALFKAHMAKLICEFKRISLKKPSVLKKLPADGNGSVLSGTVHLNVWRTVSQDGDETQTMYFGYLIICPSITQNGSQWCLNNILSDWLWAKTSSTHKKMRKVR